MKIDEKYSKTKSSENLITFLSNNNMYKSNNNQNENVMTSKEFINNNQTNKREESLYKYNNLNVYLWIKKNNYLYENENFTKNDFFNCEFPSFYVN